MNPKAPILKVKIKIHRPLAPVINNIPALSYKIAKFLTKKIKELMRLKNKCNIINLIKLAEDITKLKMNFSQKLQTVNIKYFYINVPIIETINIIKNVMKLYDIDKEIILLKTVLNQNYFQCK
jgi:hypothetical protein